MGYMDSGSRWDIRDGESRWGIGAVGAGGV